MFLMSMAVFNVHNTILTDTERTVINRVSIYPNTPKNAEHSDQTNKVLSRYKLESFSNLKIHKKSNQPTEKHPANNNQLFPFNFLIFGKPSLLDFFQTKKDII